MRLAAAEDDAGPEARAARLGVVLAGLAQELAAARREAAVLERENAALRSRLMVGRAVSDAGRHGRAVAQLFGSVQEAAANGDFINATELRVVEVVDGGLPAEWERTREHWVDRQRSAQPRHGPKIPPLTMLERGSDRWFGE